MTEQLTPVEILKSKQNFSNFMADTPAFIISTLADYHQANGKVILQVAELTQNFETFANLLDDPMVENLPQPPFVVWTVTNPKDKIIQQIKAINKYATSGFGIFIFKAFLNDDQIDFKCLVKPELKKRQPVNTNTHTKQLQQSIWEKYIEICDGSEYPNLQISKALPQHYQYISIGKAGLQLIQTINTRNNYVASELLVHSDKTLFQKLYEHKEEIEEAIGKLEWDCKENNKSAKVRQIYSIDIQNPNNHEKAINKQLEMGSALAKIAHKYL